MRDSPVMAEAPGAPEGKDSILDTIGHTPVVRLSRIAPGCAPQLVAKLECSIPAARSRIASPWS